MGGRSHSWRPGHPTLLASLTTDEGPISTPTVTSSLVGGYRARPESLTISRLAKSAKLLRSRTLWRLSVEDTLLQRLAQGLEDMAPALGQFIQEAHAMVRPRHVARPRHVVAADEPHSRDRLVRGATRAGRDQRCAGTREAGDAVDPGGVEGFGQAPRREDGRQAAGQPRCPRARRTQEEHVLVRTPASPLPLGRHPSWVVAVDIEVRTIPPATP
jgi:hypothetical protein